MRTLFTIEPEPKKPRKKPQNLMHVIDAGPAEFGDGCIAVFKCNRCGHETDWMNAGTVTAAKRGIPCPDCNSPK